MGDMKRRNIFDLPGKWVPPSGPVAEWPYNEQHDLLTEVPGHTPEARREYLLAPPQSDQAKLNKQLLNAVRAKDVSRVQQLLGLDQNNMAIPQSACANPNYHLPNGTSMFRYAATKFNLEAMKALFKAGADPSGALEEVQEKGARVKAELPDVGERVDEVIEFFAQAQEKWIASHSGGGRNVA